MQVTWPDISLTELQCLEMKSAFLCSTHSDHNSVQFLVLHFHVKIVVPIFRREKEMLKGHRSTLWRRLQGWDACPCRDFWGQEGLMGWMSWLPTLGLPEGHHTEHPKLQHSLSWTSQIRLPCTDFPVWSLIPSKAWYVTYSLKVPLVILTHNWKPM